jgi:XTP/dITP diphosphohydrolase
MTGNTLLLATNNRGKLREMEAILSTLPIKLVIPSQIGIDLDVPEIGTTYAENAAHKAKAFSKASGMITLADDSGLEVDLLDGQPGLYSHRFAPLPNATDADRRIYLLQKLHGLPHPWKAHFHCTVAIATQDGLVRFAEGDCHGEIIAEERGTNGFGYDPIFYIKEFNRTMAELEMAVKNQISHRARAIQAAMPILLELINPGKTS